MTNPIDAARDEWLLNPTDETRAALDATIVLKRLLDDIDERRRYYVDCARCGRRLARCECGVAP